METKENQQTQHLLSFAPTLATAILWCPNMRAILISKKKRFPWRLHQNPSLSNTTTLPTRTVGQTLQNPKKNPTKLSLNHLKPSAYRLTRPPPLLFQLNIVLSILRLCQAPPPVKPKGHNFIDFSLFFFFFPHTACSWLLAGEVIKKWE